MSDTATTIALFAACASSLSASLAFIAVRMSMATAKAHNALADKVIWTNPPGHAPERLPHTAYLVLTLDVSRSPPVAVVIDVFSAAASELTIVSRTHHTVDLERMDGVTYHEAREALLRLAPQQWPWMAALIRKEN